jgi:hypothetical protein
VIANVYVFVNGMAMVFDEDGRQMPEYQGRWLEVRDKVLRDKPPHVIVIEGMKWDTTTHRHA